MPSGPSMHSMKRASEAYFKTPLQTGDRTLRRGKDSGSVVATFILVKTSTKCLQVYLVLHFLHYFQTSH
jgi:hypothetical protein